MIPDEMGDLFFCGSESSSQNEIIVLGSLMSDD